MSHRLIKTLTFVLALLATPATVHAGGMIPTYQIVYVQRDSAGNIVGFAGNPQPGNPYFDTTPTFLSEGCQALNSQQEVACQSLEAWITARDAEQALQQQLISTLAGGIVVTSTGTATLNATYATDQAAQDALSAIATSLANGLGLPGGSSTMLYADITGVPHTFTSVQILNLAKAIRDFVYAAKIAALGQGSWPSAQVTIP